jgi:hypothetical protein
MSTEDNKTLMRRFFEEVSFSSRCPLSSIGCFL